MSRLLINSSMLNSWLLDHSQSHSLDVLFCCTIQLILSNYCIIYLKIENYLSKSIHNQIYRSLVPDIFLDVTIGIKIGVLGLKIVDSHMGKHQEQG